MNRAIISCDMQRIIRIFSIDRKKIKIIILTISIAESNNEQCEFEKYPEFQSRRPLSLMADPRDSVMIRG
jgi:hypothetical protein